MFLASKWCGLVAVLAVAGCDSGGPGFQGTPPPISDPPVCESWFELEGSHAMPVGQPADEGCVPDGTWTFTTTLLDEAPEEPEPGEEVAPACTEGQLEYEDEYTVTVVQTFDEEGDSVIGQDVSFANDPDDSHTRGKVGMQGGKCAGQFTHYSADGYGVLELRPSSEKDEEGDGDTGIVSGTAHYMLYADVEYVPPVEE